MKNETTVNQAKPGYKYNTSDKVSGKYHGVDFSGFVCNRRTHSMNRNQSEITIECFPEIEVYGTKRSIITLSILDDGSLV
jgi:hypothetical protein